MPFEVKGWIDDCPFTATAETAKAAFAKAIEWQVANGMRGVSINNGSSRFTVAEFAWAMASEEIATTARDAHRAAVAPSST